MYLIFFLCSIFVSACSFNPEESYGTDKAALPVKTNVQISGNKPVVVLELFSSEGCSSCPPADAVLGGILKNASEERKAVYGLKFHVDYWDRLGWKDIYASPAFTDRQREYAVLFKASGIYTPQMVVNGHREMVGSDEASIQNAIKEEQQNKSNTFLSIKTSLDTSNSSLNIEYGIQNGVQNSLIHFALVEKEVTHHIKRGENQGRILTHNHIVRIFETEKLDGSKNTKELKIPSDLETNKLVLIVYLQEKESNLIYAANQIIL